MSQSCAENTGPPHNICEQCLMGRPEHCIYLDRNWPPRFRVDPQGGVILLLMLVRDGKRTVEEVAPHLQLREEKR